MVGFFHTEHEALEAVADSGPGQLEVSYAEARF
jgi:hypothetical protein